MDHTPCLRPVAGRFRNELPGDEDPSGAAQPFIKPIGILQSEKIIFDHEPLQLRIRDAIHCRHMHDAPGAERAPNEVSISSSSSIKPMTGTDSGIRCRSEAKTSLLQ